MVGERIQSAMPVVISHQPCIANSSWPDTGPLPSTSAPEDNVPFARPAITTGAHLPWNVSKKSAYGNPRAICTVQSVPPITLLNSRAETTKLVYSKDSENKASVLLSESPFKPRSYVSLCEEEEKERVREEKAKGQSAIPSDLRDAHAIGNTRLDSVQASSGVVSSQIIPDSSTRQIAFQSQSYGPANQAQMTDTQSMEPAFVNPPQIQQTASDWMPPILNFTNTSQKQTLDFPAELSRQDALGNGPYVGESVGPVHTRSSSLYKSSGDSSQLRASEAADPAERSGSPTGSPRSQSLTDKRKADALGPLTVLVNDPQVYQEDFKENSLSEQRPVRRRIANRSSVVSRSSDKKNQEVHRMEHLIEKLQNEQTELQVKLKKQVKQCGELKFSLELTQHKLEAQEDQNRKLKSEMEFLRQNLSMLPQPQTSFDGSLGEVTGSPTQGLLGWQQEFPFPTSMPTHAQIAADLELDRRLLASSETGQDFLTEWNI